MRHWNKARTVADLGDLMADWIEGRIPKRPGYYGSGLDPESTPIVRTLAAVCRVGFVTDSSQPGCDAIGFDGKRWVQRAAVDGFIADPALYERVVSGARRLGLTVADGRAVVVTERAGQAYTAFGERIGRRDLRTMWDGVSREAFAAVQQANHVAIIDSEWGPSDRLWRLLDQIARGS